MSLHNDHQAPRPLVLDLTLPTPEENLALDEALLEQLDTALANPAGANSAREILRFWESPEYFVVLGRSGRLSREVRAEECRRRNVKILRRVSGGGTVVQGPGCLNFSLLLSLEARPELRDLHRSYQVIMGRTAQAFQPLEVDHCGTSDLVVDDRKVSGNAQRRFSRSLLHHGTILFDFDLARVAQLLIEPARQPDYRRHRTHELFLANLGFSREEIKSRIAAAWHATPFDTIPELSLRRLVEERYANPAWTHWLDTPLDI